MLVLMMVLGSLSAGVPNARAVTGNELVYGAIYQNSNFDWNSYVYAYNLGTGASYTVDWEVEMDNSSFSSGSYDQINTSTSAFQHNIWSAWNNLSSGYYCIMSTLYEYGNSTVLYNGSSSCTSIIGSGGGTTLNETVALTNLNTTSVTLDITNLDANNSYIYWLWVYRPNGSTGLLWYSSGYRYISPGNTSVSFYEYWTDPVAMGGPNGTYRVIGEIRTAPLWNTTVLSNATSYFTIGGGGGTVLNETIALSNVTNNSASVDLANLNSNNSYYWWVFVYNSSGTLYSFDYGSISNVSGSMSYGASWITPLLTGNYTINGELTDNSTNSLANTTAYFTISGGGGTVLALDPYEPNDTPATASTIATQSSITNLTIHNSTDDDYYTFNSTGGQRLQIDITFTDSAGDLDMDIYRGANASTYVGTSTSISDDESFTVLNSTAGPYYIYVYGYLGDTNTYNLTTTAVNSSTQNDAGSGGDVGDNASMSYTLTPGNHQQYTGYVDQTDIEDWYNISVPTGYGISANLSFAASNDFDLYLVDSLATSIIDSSYFSNPETVTSNGTTVGGSNVYILIDAYTGSGSYTLDIWMFAVTNATAVTGNVQTVMYNSTDGEFLMTNLTNNAGYDLDVYLLSWNGSNFTTLAYVPLNWTANSTTHSEPVWYWWDSEESWYCLYGEMYDASLGTYIDDDMDCIYFEMMEASVTSDTSGTLDAQNLTNGESYSYQWHLYLGNGTTYLQSGNGNFTASGTSQAINLGWNQPNSGTQRCLTVVLYNSTNVPVGYHEDCFSPTWPGVTVTSVTSNNASVSNTVYSRTNDLTVSDTYGMQSFVYWYTNSTTWDNSAYTNFTATGSSMNFSWNFVTPTMSSVYCADTYLYDVNGSLLDWDTSCFTIFNDDDLDGVWNENDLCPNTPSNATVDQNGCASTQRDTDNDGVNDAFDAFPFDSTQWADTDGDGYGDNANGNNSDAFPNDATQWSDADGDGYGDNANGTNPDAFPQDGTQWSDQDGDGYGDNPNGTSPDAFPTDSTQWSDQDGDGYGDNSSGTNPDAFPQDGTQWSDQDGDGYGDNPAGNNPDAFPTDSTQWEDSDGDGYGDNPFGANPDAFPSDNTQWNDTDGDGYGDNPLGNNSDDFPNDGTQWEDSDGDGYGDNPLGNNPDAFPNDSTQWEDTDGDGYGNNPLGNNPDAFPTDGSQWFDQDGDGYGDNPQGNNSDVFPTDSSQWYDRDGDGYGDNPLGNNSDDCPDTPAGLAVDENGCAESERDSDNDGVMDDVDVCPSEDASGYDDDNDGCIDDSDHDGVLDDVDLCANEDASGYDANGDGCIDDTDGDGVKDDTDICRLEDASGFDSNADGCIDDTDGDLVKDDVDQCPTANSTGWDNDGDGCIDDTDADTVLDPLDDCPGTPVGALINSTGCADVQRDTDGDTVNDAVDECPMTPIGQMVDGVGCADSQKDTDSDYVRDDIDICPGSPAGTQVDSVGCADSQKDTDDDGVTDDLDDCDGTPVAETTNPEGCSLSQIDSDSDGWMDDVDAFPYDPAEHLDSDGDGVGDNSDFFPLDPDKALASDAEQESKGISQTAILIAAVGTLLFIAAMVVLVLTFRRKKDDGDEPDALFSGAIAQSPVEPLHTEIAAAAAAQLSMADEPALPALTEATSLLDEQPEVQEEQWTDEHGVNWYRQEDGTLLRWDGSEWQQT